MTSKKNGYVLIEAMVALGVLTSSVLGMFALMSQSIKLTRVIDDQHVGTYLAAEGIEIVKNLLDTNFLSDPVNWNVNGFAVAGCYEVDVDTTTLDSATPVDCSASGLTPLRLDGTVPLYSYGVGVDSAFSRMVHVVPIIDPVDGVTQEGVQVVSTVKWAGGESSIALEDKFYSWH